MKKETARLTLPSGSHRKNPTRTKQGKTENKQKTKNHTLV
jgi:hypothetical protein